MGREIRVFISYSRKNLKEASLVYNALVDVPGVSPWMDKTGIYGGDEWKLMIKKEIESCDYFLALFSEKAMEKEGFFHTEISFALDREKRFRPSRRFIIPARLDECDLSDYEELTKKQIIDLFDSYEDGIRDIIKVLKALPPINPEGKPREKQKMSMEYDKIISDVKSYNPPETGCFPEKESPDIISREIKQRMEAIKASIDKTTEGSKTEIWKATECFRNWMLNGTIVRVVGAGRARLAAAIPANRLAHGGARVYIQDEIIPMPHSIKGGGIIAVSASGRTPSTIEILKSAKEKDDRIIRIGIAQKASDEEEPEKEDEKKEEKFEAYCDIFIEIKLDTELDNPLQALGDTGEYVISMLLDAMVVAAGKLAGYDDAKWRLGHEDLGSTGPWDFISKMNPEDIHEYAKALENKAFRL